jgi:DNA-binding NarL/FixJ family response regulator
MDAQDATPIRIVLAGGQDLFREGIRHMLSREPDLLVVACTATGEAAFDATLTGPIDLVLLDVDLPDLSMPEALTRLAIARPSVRALVLGNGGGDCAAAVVAGAWGFLSKNSTAAEVAKAVRKVHQGELWAPRTVLAKIIRERTNPAGESTSQHSMTLSPREAAVLRLAAMGLSNNRIAETLFVEVSTIKTHLARVYKKLNVSDRAAAVMAAREAGLIPAGLHQREPPNGR